MSLLGALKVKLLGTVSLIPRTVEQRKYRKPLPRTLKGENLPTVSVIIPTRNRPRELKTCIDSVLRQTIKPLEIVVVDDGCLRTREIKGWLDGSGISLRHVRKGIPGTARSRNGGARWARGEILSFVDDDVVLAPDYTEEILRVFISDQGKKIGGVEGEIADTTAYQGIKKYYGILFGFSIPQFYGVLLPNGCRRKVDGFGFPVTVDIFAGVAAFRREVFDQFSYDQINYPGYSSGEDVEFAYRISRNFQLVCVPSALFWHYPAETGRPQEFKLYMQTVHSALKPQALNGEIGLLNYLLMGWALFGKQLVAFYGLVHPGKSKRDRFNMLLGQATGFLTLPFSIPSRNRLSYELAQWLSKVEHRS